MILMKAKVDIYLKNFNIFNKISNLEKALEKIEDEFCADWVKREMDDAEWRKMNEQERQALLARLKMEQRKLRKELYGDAWLGYLR